MRYVILAFAVLILAASAILTITRSRPASGNSAVRSSAEASVSSISGLKEVNYYPASGGWTYMWSKFDPAEINSDFARIRSVGANSVRIFIQPSVFGYPTVNPVMADHLAEVVSMAASHSLLVHLTLFDWWSQYTDIAGSKEWVSSLLSGYRSDSRIAVVELKNEVNPYDSSAVDWVAAMLPYLSTAMPGTLRTVSTATVSASAFGTFTHELANSPPDFWDYHYYGPASDARSQLNKIKALAAPRPLIIGETGYSTAGTAAGQTQREQAQAAYYRSVFGATAALGLPWPAPWIFSDFPSGAIPPGGPANNPAEYGYGLVRVDGTAKPAAAVVNQAFSKG